MMSIRTFAALGAAMTTSIAAPSAGTAQTLAPRVAGAAPVRPVALRSAYHIVLESAWPAPAGETDACNNRASETLAGTLRRVGPDRYEGRFSRRTRLGFCGSHGAAVQPCGAVLHGAGDVLAEGRVVEGSQGTPTISLVWQPVAATTRITVDGSCAPRFTRALEGMYRTAIHSVDFAIPAAGRHQVVLEDYGRTLDIH